MRRSALLLILAVTVTAADEKPVKAELPAPIRALVDLARAAPPELFANTIADLIEAGRIPQRESRIDLIEEAFTVAHDAREPYRLVAIPGVPPDTNALYRSKAGERKLDALSIESRLVREMASIDGANARALFDRAARPVLDPRPCVDPLVADISAYYEMAGVIAQSAFTTSEKQKSAHVQFLEAVLGGLRSPGELPPFVRAIGSVDLSAPQRELLIDAIAAKLESIDADYRPFAMTYELLKSELQNRGLADQPVVMKALQRYAVNQARAPRCAPEFGPKIFEGGEEVRPAKLEAGYKAEPYFQSGDSKPIGDRLAALRSSSARDGDWSNRLADFLRDFDAWRPPGDDLDIFHQRATIYRALLEMTPAGQDRERLLERIASFLATSPAERESPAEWMYQVQALSEACASDAATMWALFRTSGSPSLALYAATRPGT